MIVERESMMTVKEKENPEWFPKFIVFRRKAINTKSKDLWQESFNEIVSQMTKLESNLKQDTEKCKEMIEECNDSIERLERNM